jgi:hypothetical protein
MLDVVHYPFSEVNLIYRINRFSDFVHRPDSKELEDKKHHVSETGSVSILR